jgi:hypothetical protein
VLESRIGLLTVSPKSRSFGIVSDALIRTVHSALVDMRAERQRLEERIAAAEALLATIGSSPRPVRLKKAKTKVAQVSA